MQDDHYIAHVDTPGPSGGSTIMLTEHRILYIRTAKLKVLWEVVWPDLSTISYVYPTHLAGSKAAEFRSCCVAA